VCRGSDDLLDIVLFSCRLAGDSSAASVLSLVAVYSLALDITEVCESYNDILFCDK
jgi:hypothetical protein